VPARVAKALEVHHQHLRQRPQVELFVSLHCGGGGEAVTQLAYYLGGHWSVIEAVVERDAPGGAEEAPGSVLCTDAGRIPYQACICVQALQPVPSGPHPHLHVLLAARAVPLVPLLQLLRLQERLHTLLQADGLRPGGRKGGVQLRPVRVCS
jgi:hypothetical protein